MNSAKPTIELVPNDYQPTKPELAERVHIPTTPEALAKAVMAPVQIRRKDVAQHKRTRPVQRRRR